MRILPLAALLAAWPGLALAHVGHGDEGHFIAGLGHPLIGPDHLLAMLAVGLWAALAGGRALWAMPLAFLAGMLAGGIVGAGGAALPVVEPAILASVVVTGAVSALALAVPLGAAVPVLAVFGLAHGHAHGLEGPGGGGYAAGFLIATAGLHLAGLAAGRLGLRLARVLGGAIAFGGATLAMV